MVDCRKKKQLLDGVTSLSILAQAASALIPSVKTITGSIPIDSFLAESPDLTCPAGVQREVRHNTLHHIRTIPGPPVTCQPWRLPPDRPAIAKAEFDAERHSTMLREFLVLRLHIVPKKDNGWRPCGEYRALNSRIINHRYPVWHIQNYSHQLFGCSIFSKIDIM
jgi:hypothetical protein